jgi:ribosomal-protein-alanine N-acetyltransferase
VESLNLNTKNLVLQKYTKKYLKDLYNHRSDPEIAESYLKEPKNINEFKKYLKEFNKINGKRSLFVILKDSILIGDISYNSWGFENKVVAIGFSIATKYQMMGFGKEAVSEIVRYLFLVKNVQRIQAEVNSDNIPSCKLLERVGFIEEGRLRQVEYNNGKWEDLYVYSMLRNEYKN